MPLKTNRDKIVGGVVMKLLPIAGSFFCSDWDFNSKMESFTKVALIGQSTICVQRIS